MTRPEGQGHPAWQAALSFTGLLLVAVVIRVIALPVLHPELWIAVCALYVTLLAILLAKRGDEAVGTKVLAVAVAGGVVQVSIANELIARAGVHVEPFIGAKLMALALALIAPPSLWIAVVALLATAVVPLVEFYHWPAHVQATMPMNEPWTTLLYAVIALGLLLHRRHQLAAHRQMVRAQTRAASFEAYTRKFLAVRDLSSSPLQSIETTVGLLRCTYPASKRQFDRIGRQLDRLRVLNVALSRYEPKVWRPDDCSVDPLEVLEELDEERAHR